jgi:hypothetical protein
MSGHDAPVALNVDVLGDRFWSKTTPSDCIVWTGALNSRGYPMFRWNGNARLAHRLAWEEAHGPIPDGMTIDHLCLNQRCVKVDHLEVVSVEENSRRKAETYTECSRGHTLVARKRGSRWERRCATCETEQRIARREDERAAS